jgi:hypothetical protein
LGIETFFKYPEIIKCGDRELKRVNWEVGIAVDVFKNYNQSPLSKTVILGSGSNNMTPLASYLTTTLDVECVVFSCSVGKELRHSCTEVLEITEDILE